METDMQMHEKCTNCNGTGLVLNIHGEPVDCPVCGNSGVVVRDDVERVARAIATCRWRQEWDEFTEPEMWADGIRAYDMCNNNERFHFEEMAAAAIEAFGQPFIKYHEDKAAELSADMDNDDGHYGAVHAAHIFAAHHFRTA